MSREAAPAGELRQLAMEMASALVHRGPDEEGFMADEHCAIGVRRLSVLDLQTGSQPMAGQSGVWVAQNGEIYNFRELRRELAASGGSFRSEGDTECILRAYERYGDACLERLRGMFALAIWDAPKRRLLLARDRLGKKPLFYAQLGGQLYFASELQALLRLPCIPRDIDWAAFGEYLTYGYVPQPASIFSVIRKLPPGHLLTWEAGQLAVRPYWTLRYEPKVQLSEAEAVERLDELLTEAVRLRMIADVPLGALLSGGVDSSLVVALMARQSARPVKTFSVGFDEAGFDELKHAGRVAKRYGTDHHEVVVRPDAAAVLPLLARHYGEPYADSSAIPTYYVSKLAREHVTVALNGDGGDEDFAGYDRYRAMCLAEGLARVPLALPIATTAGSLFARLLPRSRLSRRTSRFLEAAALPESQRYARWMSQLSSASLQELLTPELRAELAQAGGTVETALASSPWRSPIDRLLDVDVRTYLANDTLIKMDIASMANSLETRSPLLDQEVVQFAASLPASLKLRAGWQQKYLLKRLARKYVPAENIDRPKKGFGVPVGAWLRTSLCDMAEELLFSGRSAQRGYFEPRALRRVWEQHQHGSDHAKILWPILMLELWQREVLEVSSPAPQVVPA